MRAAEGSRETGSVFGFAISLGLLALLLFLAGLRAAEAGGGAATDFMGFAGALIALMLASRLWARASLARLDLEAPRRSYRAFAGESFELRLELRNRKALPVVARIEPWLPEALSPSEADGPGGVALGAFARAELAWRLTARRRGVYRLGSATLSAGDLLGLHRRERTVGLGGEVVAFPRIVPISELEPPFRDCFGIHPSGGLIEDPAWYEGTREYSGHRPAKAIHWKASARLGILQEKIYQPTSQLKVAFLLDGGGFLAAGDEEGLERALEVLASTASRFAEKGASFAIAVDLEVEGGASSLPFGRGSEHLGSLLELLARCAARPGAPLLPPPAFIASASSGLVVVARSPDERTRRYYSLPARGRDRILFLFAEGAEGSGYPCASFGAARDDGDVGGDGAASGGER